MRHAIQASFITPVGDRYSQVIDSMTKSILHFRKLRSAEILCNRPDAGIIRVGHRISPVIDELGSGLRCTGLKVTMERTLFTGIAVLLFGFLAGCSTVD